MFQALNKNVSSKFLSNELQQKLKYNCIRNIPTFRYHYRISSPSTNFPPHTHTYLACTSLLEINVVCSALRKLRMKSKFNSRVRLKSETQLSILQFAPSQQMQSRQILKSGIIPTL